MLVPSRTTAARAGSEQGQTLQAAHSRREGPCRCYPPLGNTYNLAPARLCDGFSSFSRQQDFCPLGPALPCCFMPFMIFVHNKF